MSKPIPNKTSNNHRNDPFLAVPRALTKQLGCTTGCLLAWMIDFKGWLVKENKLGPVDGIWLPCGTVETALKIHRNTRDRNLKILEEMGLITSKAEGWPKKTCYFINDAAIRLLHQNGATEFTKMVQQSVQNCATEFTKTVREDETIKTRPNERDHKDETKANLASKVSSSNNSSSTPASSKLAEGPNSSTGGSRLHEVHSTVTKVATTSPRASKASVASLSTLDSRSAFEKRLADAWASKTASTPSTPLPEDEDSCHRHTASMYASGDSVDSSWKR